VKESSPSPETSGDFRLLVHAYSDDELDAVNAVAIGNQIESDPDRMRQLAEIVALRQALRAAFPVQPVPRRLAARINAEIGDKKPRQQPGWTTLAASVLVALAIGSGSTWMTLHTLQRDTIAEQVVATHMRALVAPSPTDVKSSERHTVKPWFNGRIPISPRVIDLSSHGFPLVGARIDVFGTTPVPTLVYARRLHVISLCAIPSAAGSRSSPITINGYNVVSWTQDGTTYWAVSDLSIAELNSFAELFRNAPG
jgi:anti-sigma factor RsiW